MTTSNPVMANKLRYSRNVILDLTTWCILLYMVFVDIPSLGRLVGYMSLGITPLLIVVYAICILLAGIGITVVRHRIPYQVTSLTFVVNILIQLFVVMIASNPIHWQLFVFAILGQWFIVETLRAVTFQKDTAASNLVSLCIFLAAIFIWRNLEQNRASLILNVAAICFWIMAEWFHTQQNTLIRLSQIIFRNVVK